MRKSRKRRRYKYILVFIISFSIVVIFYTCFLPAGVKFIMMKRLNIEGFKESNLSISRCNFSFRRGIIFKNVRLQSEQGDLRVKKVIVRRDKNGVVLIIIRDAVANLSSLNYLFFKKEVKNREFPRFEISLANVQLNTDGRDAFTIKNGFISSDSKGANWNFSMDSQLTNIETQGYFSASDNCSYFKLIFPLLNFVFAGEYNFNKDNLRGKLYYKDRGYNVTSNLSYKDGAINLSNIALGKLFLPGPIILNRRKEITSDWKFENQICKAQGRLGFQRNSKSMKFYLKVNNAQIKDYKLVTNFYLNYYPHEKRGEFETLGTVLNNKPFPELKFSFRFLKNGVLIDHLKYQGGFSLSGYMDFDSNISFKGTFKECTLENLLNVILPLYARYLKLGNFNGELSYFSFKGMELIEVTLTVPQGRIGDISFQKGKIHLVGNSKNLEFVNSELVVNGKPTILEGKLDMSKFPHPEAWEKIYLVSLTPSFPWGEIGFEEKFGEKTFYVGTKLKENISLDYNVAFSEEENYNINEVSLEVKGKPDLKLRLRENEEIMGVEKSIKF